jgi:prophage antirepressor-like protein
MTGLDEEQDIPQTILFEVYATYLLNDLIKFDRAFFVGCKNKPRETIQKKNIPEDQYWFATCNKQTNVWSHAISENKKAKLLISQEWVHNNLPKFTGNENAYKYKPLPPLLELSEEEKFTDIYGNIYEVEVRGEKSKDNIRFRWKDVAGLLEMETNNLRYILNKVDYDVFCSVDPIKYIGSTEQNIESSSQNASSKVSYLTYNGLLKIIFKSRSGVAYKFQDWATKIIYAAHLGTTEQKVDIAADIVGINAQMVKDVLTTCITSMPCIYLFNVGKITELRKHYDELKPYKKGFLFKWGRTNDLKRRTSEHIKTYGNFLSSTLQLKYFSPIDNIHEVSAENEIRHYFRNEAINFKNHKELVILDKSQLCDAKKFYEDIYFQFSSEVNKLLTRNNTLKKDNEYLKNFIIEKNKRVDELNEECKNLRAIIFHQQAQELKYKKREEEYREKERNYREEIQERRQKSAVRNREMELLMERLSIAQQAHQQTTEQLSIAQQEYKNCQDVLCDIAHLTPAERQKLDTLFAGTREKLEPFINK